MARHSLTAAVIKEGQPPILQFLATTRAGERPRVPDDKREERKRRYDEG